MGDHNPGAVHTIPTSTNRERIATIRMPVTLVGTPSQRLSMTTRDVSVPFQRPWNAQVSEEM